MLEVFNNLFMSIAEQMGVTLQNTAYSVNIKERLDFSCAVFDADGALVANAPHMPVHLGSMDRSVETIIRMNEGSIRPGDVFALNAPYNGGTHLPDITVVHAGVRRCRQASILFWVASRGHHADVGGIAPGSMTPLATTIDEEGVCIDNFRSSTAAASARRRLVALLTDASLSGAQRRAERRRPEGADRRQREGRARAAQDGGEFGLDVVQAYMGHVQDNAAESVRRVLDQAARLRIQPIRRTRAATIRVKITVDQATARGDGRLHRHLAAAADNFNAPEPVTRAAVLYVFRVMVEDDIPMNAGCLRPDPHRHPRRLDALAAHIRPPSSPATSRRRRPSPTACSARSRRCRPRRAR